MIGGKIVGHTFAKNRILALMVKEEWTLCALVTIPAIMTSWYLSLWVLKLQLNVGG